VFAEQINDNPFNFMKNNIQKQLINIENTNYFAMQDSKI